MIRQYYIFLILLFGFNVIRGQENQNTTKMTNEYKVFPIKDAVELVKDSLMRSKLIEFKNDCSPNDDITVEEFENYFEIIVSHPSFEDSYGNVFSGGAEQYFLDKEKGKISMGWHEHPMQMPEMIDINNSKEEDPKE
jgi:hypothetical protein